MDGQLDPKMLENLELLLDYDVLDSEDQWEMLEHLEPTEAGDES